MQNILGYLSEYKQNGSEYIFMTCPFCRGGQHHDKYKFFINADKETYICHRGKCNAKGHISELYKHFGVEYKRENDNYNTTKKAVVKAKDFSNFKLELLTESDAGHKYLQLRKISKETIEFFKISKDSKGNIIFPFYKDGKLQCIKYRLPHKAEKGQLKTWQEVGGLPVLLNADNVDWTKPVALIEGEIDSMSVWQSGFKNVVSIPFGVNNWKWIDLYWDKIEKCPELIACGDQDEAGQKFNAECIKKFGVDKVKIAKAGNYNDFNLLLFKEGEEAVKNAIKSAEFELVDGLIEISEVGKYEIDETNRIDTGFQCLNTYLNGFLPGTLTILSGKPGHGKSTLASQFIIEAINNNIACCVYSGELTNELFKQWLFLQICGKYVKKKYDKFRKIEVEYIEDHHWKKINEWVKNKLFIYDDTVVERKSMEEASILKIFEYAAKRHNCRLFLVDNLMTAKNQYYSAMSNENFYQKQGEFILGFKKFGIKYNVSVIFVIHLVKNSTNSGSDNDDIEGSSTNSKAADNILKTQRVDDLDENEAEQCQDCTTLLHITKNRLYGQRKTIKLNFIEECKRLIEINTEIKEYVKLDDIQIPVIGTEDTPW